MNSTDDLTMLLMNHGNVAQQVTRSCSNNKIKHMVLLQLVHMMSLEETGNCPIITLTLIKYETGPRIYPRGIPQVNSLAIDTFSLTWPTIIYWSNTI